VITLPRRISLCLLSLCLLALGSSCASKRVLRIETTPPGAAVLYNGEPIGVTPLDYEYLHYGVVRISLRLDGHHTHSEQLKLNPRWYSRFPMDIVTEVLIPIGWTDKRLYRINLISGHDSLDSPQRQSVLERAHALRVAGPEGPKNLPERVPAEAPPMPETEEGQ
jgi:hypothetical protein